MRIETGELHLTQAAVDKLIRGGKMTIPSRFMLVGTLWSLKFVVLDFLWRIIRKLPYERPIIATYIFILSATWIANTVGLFIECQPISLWWSIFPHPDECVQATKWLIIYEIGNMVTDLMLLALPFPILFMARVPWEKRIRLMAVFSLGFFLLAMCVVRVVQGLSHSFYQLSRTKWASLETLFATIVACAPSIYCILRRGRDSTTISAVTTNRGSRASGSFGGDIAEKRIVDMDGKHHRRQSSGTSSYMREPETRHSSLFSNYRNDVSRKAGVRGISISGRHVSMGARNPGLGGQSNTGTREKRNSGVQFDIPELEADINSFSYPNRCSVRANAWSYGAGDSDEALIDEEKGESKESSGSSEEGSDYGAIEGIMVETTWSQVTETNPDISPKVVSMVEPPSKLAEISEERV
ncbi:hypothetical protein H072_665 [Dactylellina haptotyla CBS 200.50]|uniref:Rhodopsin domain-containing protein n=1 Tax=Dactylellina haptotyla (strain CBS 200.50) TaxID=1284197 RepID=S8C116_DACHA|nr:hypothetical protein H072_665 [Dactylellina haptotyla CBS 200.50]